MTFPIPYFIPRKPPATVTYQSVDSSTADLSSYTFTSMAAGSADANRILVASIAMGTGVGTFSFGTVTIGGITATKLASIEADTAPLGIFAAVVPTGTTATVAVPLTGAAVRAMCHLFSVYGASITPTDIATSTSGPADLTVDVADGGVVIGGGLANTSPGEISWTGLTERQDTTVETNTRLSSASDAFATAQTASITATFAAGSFLRGATVSLPPL